MTEVCLEFTDRTIDMYSPDKWLRSIHTTEARPIEHPVVRVQFILSQCKSILQRITHTYTRLSTCLKFCANFQTLWVHQALATCGKLGSDAELSLDNVLDTTLNGVHVPLGF